MIARDVPAEHSEDKVHDEERSDDDEADKVDPRPCNSHCIVNLPTENQPHAAYSHTEVSSVNWDLLETHNQDKDFDILAQDCQISIVMQIAERRKRRPVTKYKIEYKSAKDQDNLLTISATC